MSQFLSPEDFIPLEPKKPTSPFLLWKEENYQNLYKQIKKDFPKLEKSKITSMLGEYWINLDQNIKDMYNLKYQQKLKDYNEFFAKKSSKEDIKSLINQYSNIKNLENYYSSRIDFYKKNVNMENYILKVSNAELFLR